MSGRIELSVADGVGRIVITRPEKHNAITREMAHELRRICLEIDGNDAIRVATICGAGAMPSGLWHHGQLRGQPLRNTVVRTPGPSWKEHLCTLKMTPVTSAVEAASRAVHIATPSD